MNVEVKNKYESYPEPARDKLAHIKKTTNEIAEVVYFNVAALS